MAVNFCPRPSGAADDTRLCLPMGGSGGRAVQTTLDDASAFVRARACIPLPFLPSFHFRTSSSSASPSTTTSPTVTSATPGSRRSATTAPRRPSSSSGRRSVARSLGQFRKSRECTRIATGFFLSLGVQYSVAHDAQNAFSLHSSVRSSLPSDCTDSHRRFQIDLRQEPGVIQKRKREKQRPLLTPSDGQGRRGDETK